MVVLLNISDPQHVGLLRQIVKEEMREAINSFTQKQASEKSYSVTQAMRLMNKGREGINKLIAEGVLKVTPDNKITHNSIEQFFGGE